MTHSGELPARLMHLDNATRALVRAAAALAGGSEDQVKRELTAAAEVTPHGWIEEVLLQTYLFAGFPRALNGMRQWRRIAGVPAAAPQDARAHDSANQARAHREAGEQTCAAVYGAMYDRLRENVRALHPLLDEWMIVEGYGKVLSRPGLDLGRRELCIVAACAATAQDRQLLSHLHGARNVGVPDDVVGAALGSVQDLVPPAAYARASGLWDRVRQ